MRTSFLLLLLFPILFTACGGTGEQGATEAITAYDSTEAVLADTLAQLPATHDCTIAGEVLEDNSFWARQQQRLIAIAADSSTNDPNFGPSHRVLLIYNTEDCSLLAREELPINVSPDFPYYLAPILYNKMNRFVGISGYDELYVYDIDELRLLPAAEPKYRTNRPSVDAQSGMIQWLEVWEDYLIGWAQDKGTFVFELTESGAPKAVLPFAEYKVQPTEFESLFLLPSEGDSVQLLIPHFDLNDGSFAINPLLDAPQPISQNIPRSALNNRFLVLRAKNDSERVYAVDLQERKRVELPAEMVGKPTQEILEYMRQN